MQVGPLSFSAPNDHLAASACYYNNKMILQHINLRVDNFLLLSHAAPVGFVSGCMGGRLPHMDEILIGAADDVVIGDGDGVDAAAAGLQDMDALQRADVPNLKCREREGGRRE